MLAALFGATMSTLDSLLNSAATIFTIDIYLPFINPKAGPVQQMKIGRIATVVLVVIACLWAPIVSQFDDGLYLFIQLYWGFIQPGIVAAFIYGLIWKRIPANAVLMGMILNIPVYGLLLWLLPNIAFLHHMGITFVFISVLIWIYTWYYPASTEVEIPVKFDTKYKWSPLIKTWSIAIFLLVAFMYILFF